ncbi:MAG: metallophosphoesterase [Bacillota bacterium]
MVAVIGDVHGCFYTFEALYNKVLLKYPGIGIYCVGDLIDRGKNSYEVVRFFIDNSIRFTPGNHDYMFYSFIKEPDSIFARSWVFNGNEATLQSYLTHYDSISEHIEWIRMAPLYYNLEDCFISHAGVSERYKKVLPANLRDNLDYLNQLIYSEHESETGVLWTRERLLNLGKMQIVGHTKQERVRVDNKSNAAYIDTGACAGNRLSAVVVHKNEITDIIEEFTHQEDI